MTEKIPKNAIPQILDHIADKFNLKVIRKDTTNPKPELAEGVEEKYDTMNAKELTTELRNVDMNLKKLQSQEATVKEAIINFMNEQKPEECKAVFSVGGKLELHKLQIHNKKLMLTTNLKNYVANLLQTALENELTEKFVAVNPELIDVVTSIKIMQMPPHGNRLIIRLNEKIKTEEIKEENPKGESKSTKGATTMKSMQ